MASDLINYSNTTPAAPAGAVNIQWQGDGGSPRENISAYIVPSATGTFYRGILSTTVGSTTLTLPNTPKVGSEQVFRNGALQYFGSGNDYTINGSTITLNAAAIAGDIFYATYQT
jgi:hypothetical protein